MIHFAPSTPRDWLARAANRGDAEAQFYLGVMVRDGLGVASSRDSAIGWFEKSARQGFVTAYYPTGQLLFIDWKAHRESQVLAKAYMWLTAAARQTENAADQKSAKADLERILKVMPAPWRSDLDVQVDAHFVKHPG